MKIMHLSDLHLGKRVNGFDMIEDQRYILNKIIEEVKKEKPDAVVIAGDIYDTSIASASAMNLFEHFITNLNNEKVKVFILAGNHDSVERISFGSDFFSHQEIYFSRAYEGSVRPIVLKDEYGEVNFYMLPFVKPIVVRAYFEDKEIKSYTDALAAAIEEMEIDMNKRNIIVAHQFITGAERSDSEEISVGGSDNISASVFDGFDYVALGHLHRPQKVEKETIRYSGSPLKYSFSEAKHNKSITIIELKEKGNIEIRLIPLIPKRDLIEIKGKFNDLTTSNPKNNANKDSYVKVVLTDDNELVGAMSKLRDFYPNIMQMEYDNTRTQREKTHIEIEAMQAKSPREIIAGFFKAQMGKEMNEEQIKIVEETIEEIWGNI